MATISTHTLNSVDGTHAGGIGVTISRIDADGTPHTLISTSTDDGGRLSETIAPSELDSAAHYEMVLNTAEYFQNRNGSMSGMRILQDVVIRFQMPDPDARYHMPLMLAPHSYSVWFSS